MATSPFFTHAPARAAETPVKEKLEQLSRDYCPDGMAFIPPGGFDMGCSFDDTDCQPDERPPVRVFITRPFCMGRREVAEYEFTKVMRTAIRYNHGCGFGCPATNVTWPQAAEYCAKTGGRLPSEAEWEYAARALTTSRFYWGSTANGNFTWFRKNSNGARKPTGLKQPNRFGLYDMLGNAAEWVRDCYDERWYRRMPNEDPLFEKANCDARVLRGGTGFGHEAQLRVSKRAAAPPGYWNEFFGFRCAVDVK